MIDLPEPVPTGRQVVVKVLASTINIDDIHIAEGTFYGGIPIGPRPAPARPVTPGSDLAGIVIRVGDSVRSVRVGDAVFGVQTPFRPHGSWAESCVIDERWLTRKPEKLPFAAAAACGVSGLVALSALHALNLRAGSRVVIVGATGGIGGMAVQLAARTGAEIVGVCSAANAPMARQLGCSQVLDYRREPWDSALVSSGSPPMDAVLDLVGGGDVEQAGRRVLDKHGIFVTVVGPRRFIGDRPLGWVGVLSVLAQVGYRTLLSRWRGPRYILTGPSLSGGKDLVKVAVVARAGVLPPIDSTVPFDLEAVRQALRRAATHRNHGRIVIQMDQAA